MEQEKKQQLLSDLLAKEEIISIDIRYTDDRGFWQGISIPCSNFSQEVIQRGILIAEKAINIDLDRAFVDPFLSHKTLVFLADIHSFSSSENFSSNEEVDYEVKFYFQKSEKDKITPVSSSITPRKYSPTTYQQGQYQRMPTAQMKKAEEQLYDDFKDIRTEIVMALSKMGVTVKYHYLNYAEDIQNIVISNKGEKVVHLDNIQKAKYVIMMVAKAYNLNLSMQKGIFLEYKNMYEILK